MGVSTSNGKPRWLVLDINEDIQFVSKLAKPSLLWFPRTYHKGKDNDSEESQFQETIENNWSYYRWKMQKKTRNSQTSMKPSKMHFIIAEYHENTKNNIISEALRLSLLNNLSKLSKDKSIEYDIRNLNGSKYLYPKTNQFGKADKKTYTKKENQIININNNSNNINDDDDLWSSFFYDSDDDYIDKNNHQIKIENNEDNTAMIHDLIDPNKNTMDHKLWIPAIFNCTDDGEFGIDSEILNLDRIKYKSLYTDIGEIFCCGMKKSFENVLGRTLYDKEKIIVKCMKYLLNKPGDEYIGNIHREGMGENIIASGIYYPFISNKIDGGNLELTVVCSDQYSFNYSENTKKHQLKIMEGSMIIFSNECYHRLISIKYNKNNGNNDDDDDNGTPKQLERTILAYFLISPNAVNVPASNDKRLGQTVNLCYNSKYVLDNWWREEFMNNNVILSMNKKWFMNIVISLLCGDFDYIYDKRDEMRAEKGKGMKGPPKRQRMSFGCLEGGTPM